jgi:hypothetical protein
MFFNFVFNIYMSLFTFNIPNGAWSRWVSTHPTPIVYSIGGFRGCVVSALHFAGLITETEFSNLLAIQSFTGSPGMTETEITRRLNAIREQANNSLPYLTIVRHSITNEDENLSTLLNLLPNNYGTFIVYYYMSPQGIQGHCNILARENDEMVLYEPNLNIRIDGSQHILEYFRMQNVTNFYSVTYVNKKNVKTIMKDFKNPEGKREFRQSEVSETRRKIFGGKSKKSSKRKIKKTKKRKSKRNY